MKKLFALFSVVCSSILFYSCSTDFNVIAPYKETMVIYGLLNPADSTEYAGANTQYIRIGKAFLGEGNSLIMAQQKDSINYADILTVKVQRILNGTVLNTFNLVRDTTQLKNSGLFYYPYAVLYKFNHQVAKDDGSIYKLIVYNTKSGLTATAETNTIGQFDLTTPTTNPAIPFSLYSNIFTKVEFSSAANAWVYNMTIRFHYKDVVVATQEATAKYVDWNFGDQAVGSNPPSTIVYSEIYRPDIYRVIGDHIAPADTNIIRRVIEPFPIEIILTAGTEDLYTYQKLTQPSFGVVQDRPLFSNITNGIGLFTSRYTKSVFKNIDLSSWAAFDTSRYTKYIHFIHP